MGKQWAELFAQARFMFVFFGNIIINNSSELSNTLFDKMDVLLLFFTVFLCVFHKKGIQFNIAFKNECKIVK